MFVFDVSNQWWMGLIGTTLYMDPGYVFEDRLASNAEIGSSEANHTAFDQRRSFVAQSQFKKLTYWYTRQTKHVHLGCNQAPTVDAKRTK